MVSAFGHEVGDLVLEKAGPELGVRQLSETVYPVPVVKVYVLEFNPFVLERDTALQPIHRTSLRFFLTQNSYALVLKKVKHQRQI